MKLKGGKKRGEDEGEEKEKKLGKRAEEEEECFVCFYELPPSINAIAVATPLGI